MNELSKKEIYEKKTEELITPIVESYGFELVDVEYVREVGTWYLRAFIDKPGGIAVDDCAVVSRQFSEILDAQDYISEAYIFEVSSPGLGRPFKKDKDYDRHMGDDVEIRTYRPINKQKEFIGILKAYDKNTVTMEIDEEDVIFEKADIALIRQSFEW